MNAPLPRRWCTRGLQLNCGNLFRSSRSPCWFRLGSARPHRGCRTPKKPRRSRNSPHSLGRRWYLQGSTNPRHSQRKCLSPSLPSCPFRSTGSLTCRHLGQQSQRKYRKSCTSSTCHSPQPSQLDTGRIRNWESQKRSQLCSSNTYLRRPGYDRQSHKQCTSRSHLCCTCSRRK